MKRIVIATGLLTAWFSGAAAGTLDTVKQRGTLVCGVSAGFAGFSAPDSQGNYKGLDVDYCRALAAGVLGDANKVRYVALTAQNRFTALQSGEIDVLYRNSTQTFLRGVTLGLRQGPINFYDGQGFVVRRDSGVKDLKGLNGATVCVAQGTTHEVTLGDYGRANGIEWKPLVFDRIDTMYQTFFGGRCDAMTQDASALAGAVTTAAPNAADYLVLPQAISKEPLGPFTRNGDEVWTDIIAWLHYGLVEAEELGVTTANADEMSKSTTPAIQRLIGASGDLGSRLGLDNKWILQAVKAGGNYGEIFERNVGKASPLWLVGYFVLATIGELYLAPVGLALISKMAPTRMLSMMMGVWFATTLPADILAGFLGGFWSRMAKPDFFLMIAVIPALAGAAMWAFQRLVVRNLSASRGPGA